MSNNCYKFLLLCLITLTSLSVTAQTKFVNEFLNIGVGGRAHGLFGSMSSTVDDVTSGYWNPAGLCRIDKDYQAAAMHASWFGGIANYDYLGVGKRMGDWRSDAYGSFSFIRMGIDNIPNTINLIGPDGAVNYENVTQFSAADYAFLFSYGRNLFDIDLNVGATAKIIYRDIGDFGNAFGFGFDLGAQLLREKFSLGLMLRDITTTVNVWTFELNSAEQAVFIQTGNEVPSSSTEIALPKVVFGGSYHNNAEEGLSYLITADLRISSDGTSSGIFSGDALGIDPSFGLELGYDSKVYLRLGFGNIQKTLNEVNSAQTSTSLQPNLGLGLALGRLHVDYALTNIGSVSGVLVSHVFSVMLDFND